MQSRLGGVLGGVGYGRGRVSNTLTVSATIAKTEIEAFEDQVVRMVLERLGATTASPWMNVERAAEYLDWPQKRLYNLVAAREIPHRKQGGRLLFHRDELDEWLHTYYEGPPGFGP